MSIKNIMVGLGVASAIAISVIPLGGVFADEVTLNVNIGSTIAIAVDADTSKLDETDGLAEITIQPNTISSDLKSNVSVFTNDINGYTLVVNDKDTNNSLVHTTNSSYAINSTAGALTRGTAGWNISVATPVPADSSNGASVGIVGANSGDTRQNVVIPAYSDATSVTPLVIASNSNTNKTAIDESVEVTYNISTDSNQLTGIYEDQIVYTASVNSVEVGWQP